MRTFGMILGVAFVVIVTLIAGGTFVRYYGPNYLAGNQQAGGQVATTTMGVSEARASEIARATANSVVEAKLSELNLDSRYMTKAEFDTRFSAAFDTKIVTLSNTVADLSGVIPTLRTDLGAAVADIAGLQASLKASNAATGENDERLKGAIEATNKSVTELATQVAALQPLVGRVTSLESELEAANDQLTLLKGQVEKLTPTDKPTAETPPVQPPAALADAAPTTKEQCEEMKPIPFAFAAACAALGVLAADSASAQAESKVERLAVYCNETQMTTVQQAVGGDLKVVETWPEDLLQGAIQGCKSENTLAGAPESGPSFTPPTPHLRPADGPPPVQLAGGPCANPGGCGGYSYGYGYSGGGPSVGGPMSGDPRCSPGTILTRDDVTGASVCAKPTVYLSGGHPTYDVPPEVAKCKLGTTQTIRVPIPGGYRDVEQKCTRR